jgi:hypothetical protein
LGKQALDFFPGYGEVLIDHLFEVGSLFNIGVDVLSHDVPDLLESKHIVQSLIFLVETDAPLDFADCGLVAASQAGA